MFLGNAGVFSLMAIGVLFQTGHTEGILLAGSEYLFVACVVFSTGPSNGLSCLKYCPCAFADAP
jgi:hypothetical protein